MGRKAKKLTKQEMRQFKKILLKLKEEILEDINYISRETRLSSKEATGNVSSFTLHPADMASDNFERELSLGLASNERELLFAINEALERIEMGKYGICVNCGNPISRLRLKAIPYTQLCKKCQEESEKRTGV